MKVTKTKSFRLATNSQGNPKANKLAVMLPGRLDTKDYDNFNKHLELFSKKGFLAVSFDPPGTWDSPGSTELFSTTNYIKAVNELIEYFVNKPTVLLGHSRGGATAILVGEDNPHVIGLVLVNPSLGAPSPPDAKTLKTGVYIDYRDLPPGTRRTKKKKRFKASLNYFKDGAKYDDSEVIKKYTKPKLLIYSDKDEFNEAEYVEKIFKQIPGPKEMCKIKGTHDYRLYPKVVEKVNKEIGLFIDKYFSD